MNDSLDAVKRIASEIDRKIYKEEPVPTQDDSLIRKMTQARESQIKGLTHKLDQLAREWSAAKLAGDFDEEKTIFNEMRQVQAEIRKLEKTK